MLRTSRISGILTVFLVIIIIPLLTHPVLSSPINEAEDELKSINEQIEENLKKIEETEQEESDLLQEISDIDGNLRTSEDQLTEINSQLSATLNRCEEVEGELGVVRGLLQETEYELEELRKKLIKQNGILDKRIRNIYKQGNLTYLEVVLNASDFSDLLNRLSFLHLIINQDATLLSEIKFTKDKTDTKKFEIEKQKEEIEEKQEILKEETTKLESLKIAEESRRNEIQSRMNRKEELLEEICLDKVALKQAEKELEKSSQEIAEYIRRIENGEDSPRPVSSFRWPTSGPVTSGFGMRWHPIFGGYRMHNGIDIGAPYGQKIVAAQSGTVIFTGWKGGYGRTLMISHGGGITTLYAHTSAIYVSEGQKVEKRQKVAAVGSTGYSTGPHLHFEVRVNGEPQNPMNWF